MIAAPHSVARTPERARRTEMSSASRSSWYDPDASAWEPEPTEPSNWTERAEIVVHPLDRPSTPERARLA